MTLLLILIIGVAVLAAVGALAAVYGADSRDQIDDTHAGSRPAGAL
jgi:hypothetical protein